ncbi:glycosyltransferase [uncultured Thiodictyon sp.]|uniref:glycosyltransferase n=1 Tax=uncultured Thiodictyon sp. TaxID=1846217 RepID=UPI0025FD587A|nr:glycosyltransferase [uncultured Thiodictyon sp.]
MIDQPKPRLLVLTSTFPRWRNDTQPPFVFELSRRLTDRFDITVLAPRAPGSLEQEEMDGLNIVRFPYFFKRLEQLATHGGGILSRLKANPLFYFLVPFFVLGQLWALTRLLRRQPYAIIQAHWLIPQGLITVLARWLTRRPTPLVCTSHGADLFALRGAWLRRLKRAVIDESTMVTVVSSAMHSECLALGGHSRRVEIIPMGVDLQSNFTPDPRIIRSDDELLFVGRLVEKKGLLPLLQAMPRIVASHPKARLSIVGSGPLETALRRQVAALGIGEQVAFLGMAAQSELPNIYRRAALLVAPFIVADSGDQEGLGLVMVEAAGCGCPVVGGDVAAVTDVIQNGETGLIVDCGDPSALANAIIDLLADPQRRRRLAANARQYCRETFDWESVAERYASLLQASLTHTWPGSD